MAGMTIVEQQKLVSQYIGIERAGTLCGFTQRSLADFFTAECGLEIDAVMMAGSSRTKLEDVLRTGEGDEQAKIIRAILKKFVPDPKRVLGRTAKLRKELKAVADRLEGAAPVPSKKLIITAHHVEEAIADAEALIEKRGPVSGLDRLHTAMHGYMRNVCERVGIQYTEKTTITVLFNMLRAQHPAFNNSAHKTESVLQVLKGMASIMDALDPIRNGGSRAHANKQVLEKIDARLVVNATKTILQYVDAKLSE